jgi:ABC-type branched-subunit amino acid transport system ATPase component
MGDIVLEIKALTRRFGAFTAVDALTLSVNAGEVFGVLGSKGAGKTTTIITQRSAIHVQFVDHFIERYHALAFCSRQGRKFVAECT